MRTGQSETSSGMVKAGVPVGGRMAALTSLRESRLHVIRIRRALVILQVARCARCISNAVVAIDVTLRTLQGGVRAGQRKTGGGVVKGRVPVGRGVAGLTGLWESRLHMIRVRRALKIFQVT